MARHAGTNARTRETGIAARFAAIETGRVTRPRRTLVYGTHGIGKSSFAARFPSAIVVQTEEGLNGIEVARFPLAKTFDDVIDALGSLAEHEHAYRTVVIDSLDWLERLSGPRPSSGTASRASRSSATARATSSRSTCGRSCSTRSTSSATNVAWRSC